MALVEYPHMPAICNRMIPIGGFDREDIHVSRKWVDIGAPWGDPLARAKNTGVGTLVVVGAKAIQRFLVVSVCKSVHAQTDVRL